ncbi:Ankyrin repeat-containing domain [Trinorchestia longiramus]|nr:Ankyrin repeat-containing domain [Trinorchestia longiramus]
MSTIEAVVAATADTTITAITSTTTSLPAHDDDPVLEADAVVPVEGETTVPASEDTSQEGDIEPGELPPTDEVSGTSSVAPQEEACAPDAEIDGGKVRGDHASEGRRFFCREWVWIKLWACVEQRPAAKTCGALLMAGPGAGKTALCHELVTPSASHGRHAAQLQSRLLAHHFCHAHDMLSLCVANFVQSLVTQLSYSPLISGYKEKLETPDIKAALDVSALYHNPDEAFKRAVLFPLSEIENPQKTLLLVVDSVDEDALTNSESSCDVAGSFLASKPSNVSRTVADLLASHHHLLPSWLLLVVSARRCSRFITRQFTGFRRIALDDLRRNQVVRDVQQYILCRLDREPALRNHLSRETAEMLNQLHIKSNGCFLYLEKVLDGVSEGWVTLREIRDIPGTLNGLYLWLCQRLYPRRNFQRVAPLLAVALAARQPLTAEELWDAIRTRAPDMADDEWNKRWGLLRRVLCPYSQRVVMFHHSFAEWLLDVKHCTQKYLVEVSQGHAMLAMNLSLRAPSLNPTKVQDFAFHLARMPVQAPLQPCHLAQWLVTSGAPLDTCFEHVGPLDQRAVKLLLEAGAEPPPDPFFEEDVSAEEEDDDDEEEDDDGEETGPAEEEDNNEDRLPTEEPTTVKYKELETDDPAALGSTPPKQETSVSQEESNLNDIFTNNFKHVNTDKSSLLSKSDIVHSEVTTGYFSGASVQNESNLVNSRPRSSSNEIMCSLTELQTSVESSCVSSSRGTSGGRLSTASSGASSRRAGRREQRRRQREDPLYPYLRGGPVDQRDAAGRTLLHTAAHQGDASLVRLLLEAHASHSVQDCGGQTPLHLAARQGHAEVVATLLAHRADPDLADGDGWTALRSAAWGGHADVVSVLLHGRAHVDLADGDGRTALRAAAWGGHEEVVALLLQHKASVDLADSEGRTPLIAAAYMGHGEIVEPLLAAGADVNHADVDGRTALSVAALCVAASEGHIKVVTTLLEHGAHVDHQDCDGLTPLLVAAFEGHTEVSELLYYLHALLTREVCELLLEYEADVDHVDRSGRTPLLAAASMGHAAVVQHLLYWGCYVDHIDAEGRTVLSVAAAQGSLETVNLLLARGLDETHRDNAGWTPLHYASFEGHRSVAASLIAAGARVNQTDNDGKHALVLAAQEGHALVVALLLDSGADIDHTSHDGRSALRVAALEGHRDVVHLLLCRGADLSYRDADGRTTLYLLALENNLSMARFLLESNADVSATDLEGRTPLHVTAWQGHSHMVALLLAHGAAVDATDCEKRTPLQSAAWQGHSQIVRLLLEAGAAVDHTCSQGATALSIAAQEGHEECVVELLKHGANPSHSDRCGRTAIKVALKGGHHKLAKLLEDHLEQCGQLTSNYVNAGALDASKQPCSALLCPGLTASPADSPESTFEKRRSTASLGQSSKSSNLTSSTRSSGGGHRSSLQKAKALPAPAAPVSSIMSPLLSFTQQLQQCGRGRRHPPSSQPAPLTPMDDPSSPIYASPPVSPLSDHGAPLPVMAGASGYPGARRYEGYPGGSSHVNPVVALMEDEYCMPYQKGLRPATAPLLSQSSQRAAVEAAVVEEVCTHPQVTHSVQTSTCASFWGLLGHLNPLDPNATASSPILALRRRNRRRHTCCVTDCRQGATAPATTRLLGPTVCRSRKRRRYDLRLRAAAPVTEAACDLPLHVLTLCLLGVHSHHYLPCPPFTLLHPLLSFTPPGLLL